VALAIAMGAARGQLAGTLVDEVHPPLMVSTCDTGGCPAVEKSVTVDANWRWLEDTAVNCFTGNLWDQTNCPSTAQGSVNCATNCALEGATYEASYGILTSQKDLELAFVTTNTIAARTFNMMKSSEELTNIGSRTYLMASDTKYEMFRLKNKEFTFTVDVSQLGCGLNGALYFVEMDEDGGLEKYDTNMAGAKYGTGYCDAQCPHDLKFINGEANTLDWVPSETDANTGTGHYGTCCMELDIWEANKWSQQVTPHTCSTVGQVRCEGASCGDNSETDPESRFNGMCDKNGCDFNPYRFGIEDFYGPGPEYTINTNKPITVVTQFITTDGTDDGDLSEIRRFFIQDNQLYPSPSVSMMSVETGEVKAFSTLTDDFCASEKILFNETHNGYKDHGGMRAMGESMDRGHVLVMSLWDDHYVNMLWLDSTYPTDGKTYGDVRGPCDIDSGLPADIEVSSANATVVFSNVKTGPLGTTFLQQN
jgi:cellulose 1,4-beta-cellobiosidase